MVDVVVPQGIVEGISQELQRTPKQNPKGISKETHSECQRKESQSNFKGTPKEFHRNHKGNGKESEEFGRRGHAST